MSSDFGKQSIKNRRERYAVRGNDRASPLGFRSSPSASPAENVSPYSGKVQPLRNYARRAWGVPERGWAFPLGFSIVAIGVCKKKHQPTGWCFFLSYRNTIDFRTPNLKITMCETTLQALLWLPCIISRIKLQNPVILRQHLHLANSNGVELCQPFRLRYSFINEHGIQIFQV